MSRALLPLRVWRAARLREAVIVLGYGLPWLVAITVFVWRRGTTPACSLAIVLLLAGLALLYACWQRLNAGWLIRALNTQRPDMEDSADLLLIETPTLLQQLQQQRLQQRLANTPTDLRRPWPWRRLLLSCALALFTLWAATHWPHPSQHAIARTKTATAGTHAGPIRLLATHVQITPPVYTGLPVQLETRLSFKLPQSAQVTWRLQFSGSPSHVALVLLDGRRIPMQRIRDTWQTKLQVNTGLLYRVAVGEHGVDGDTLHRIDVLPDRPPQVNVSLPTRSLSLAPPAQAAWEIAFDAKDDYGLAATAQLRLTLAQGSGENIAFREHSLNIAGHGNLRQRRYATRLDLRVLGMAEGDDLIAQLTVSDNRHPQAQQTRSPSVILRMSRAATADSTGVEGVVRRVMPAYFRSQRQIIIDAEALLKQRRSLAAAVFLQRSDAIGVDQRILRLRYGQFLGEEAEGGSKLAPTADADTEHTASVAETPESEHDHAPASTTSAPTPAFGQIDHLLENFGHTHDIAEAATLLDPQTRAILKQALDQMWQSELQLRQGQPDAALPFAYKALRLIKQVQQADRIFLARVGPQLPAIDESRRLSGKREGITSRPDSLPAATQSDHPAALLWQALTEAAPAEAVIPSLTHFEQWLQRTSQPVPDPLAVQAAAAALRRSPGCAPCRMELQRQLWPLLPVPPAQPARRTQASSQGQRYLDALQAEPAR